MTMEGEIVEQARKSLTPIVVASISGFCGGSLVGFLVARVAGRKEIDKKIAEEIISIRDHYIARAAADALVAGARDNGDEWAIPSVGAGRESGTLVPAPPVLRPLIPRIETPGYALDHPSDVSVPEADPVPGSLGNTDAGGRDPFDGIKGDGAEDAETAWPAETPAESPVPPVGEIVYTPIVITRTQFYDETETNNQKLTITYYDGDKVLADDKDVPIRDNASVVGTDFVNHFGSPEDPDVVYIRNNRLRIDFEVVRDERGYAEAILNYGRPR